AAGDARVRCEAEGGLRLLCAQVKAGSRVCIRPENITIGKAPMARENCFTGHITDAVHLAGSVRYRVAITPDCSVIVRKATGRRDDAPVVDDEVHVGWDAEDILVLSE